METKLLYLVAIGLYGIGALFMRNTHPYAGSRGEKFESKQKRKLVGTFLLASATVLVGVAALTQVLMSRN